MDNIYLQKYLKYKSKYFELLQNGSSRQPALISTVRRAPANTVRRASVSTVIQPAPANTGIRAPANTVRRASASTGKQPALVNTVRRLSASTGIVNTVRRSSASTGRQPAPASIGRPASANTARPVARPVVRPAARPAARPVVRTTNTANIGRSVSPSIGRQLASANTARPVARPVVRPASANTARPVARPARPVVSTTNTARPALASAIPPEQFLGEFKTLYIGLPIDSKSTLGQNLSARDSKLEFSDYKNKLGTHLTLIMINVSVNTNLHRLLSNSADYEQICGNITQMFRDIIKNTKDNKELILSSIPNNYEQLNSYYTKKYSSTFAKYTDFRKQINEHFMQFSAGLAPGPIPNWWKQNVVVSDKKNVLNYKLFSLRQPTGRPKPIIAQSQHFTDWLPHLSIFNTTKPSKMTSAEIEERARLFKQNALAHSISQIRLWPKDNVHLNKGTGGDITHMYFSYDFKNHLYIQL